eukprot:scaffold30814_cov19-Prasinocladus_malaysianus.AAC.1
MYTSLCGLCDLAADIRFVRQLEPPAANFYSSRLRVLPESSAVPIICRYKWFGCGCGCRLPGGGHAARRHADVVQPSERESSCNP